jgi:hypothetical protein
MKRFNLLLSTGIWLLASTKSRAVVDTNNNGMSDPWEKAFNSQQLYPASFVAQNDDDGDGFTNFDESIAGTDPKNGEPPVGFLQIHVTRIPAVYITPEGGGDPELVTPEAFIIGFPSVFGKQYTVLYSPELSTGSWVPVDDPLTGFGNDVHFPVAPTFSDGTMVPQGFWRVAVMDTDTDGDGFTDYDELQNGTDPQVADRDDDGLPDDWEIIHGLEIDDDGSINPANGATGDPDGDGLPNYDEFYFAGDPGDSDTDDDEIDDSSELWILQTLLDDPDTDGDGTLDGADDNDDDSLTNFAEIYTHHTDPLDEDTDRDKLHDAWELDNGLDPCFQNVITDPDGDGLTNFQEQLIGLKPLLDDSDEDGTLDGAEDIDNDSLTNIAELNIHRTNPLKADTDNDDLTDDAEINIHLTDPTKHDSDSDGIPDGWEVDHNLNPNNATGDYGTTSDPDGDGLGNFDEWLHNTDPRDDDSDDDMATDGVEVAQSSDPNYSADGGQAPPAEELLAVPFTIVDPSGSHSEKWKLTVRGLGPNDHQNTSITSPKFGEPASATMNLRKENRYEISVCHLGTDPEYLDDNDGKPDYDWEATVDDKPGGRAEESFDGIPGSYNYFTVKDHWIVDNRQAVLTRLKHGDDEDLITGHTATFIPIPIERDIDVLDNNWQKITGGLAEALPGQKINLRINQSRLPSSIVLSNLLWSLPPPVFKNFEANQQTGTLTPLETGDLNQPDVHFYFTNAGTKTVSFGATVNGEAIALDVSLDVLEPVANFTRILDTVKLYTDPFTQIRRVGLVEKQYVIDDIYFGIQWEGDVTVPAGWPQGKWQWVQTGTPNISVTRNNGDPLVFSTNGQTGLDTRYPTAPLPKGSHPGTAGGYPTGVYDRSDMFGDSPSLPLTDYRDCSYAASFTTYMMFLPDGTESRYVPLKSMAWNMHVTAAKDTQSGEWSISSSGQDAQLPETTTTHPNWTLNIMGDFVPP